MSALARGTALVALAMACVLAPGAPAGAQDITKVERELADIAGDADQARKVPLTRSQLRSATHVALSIATGNTNPSL